MKTSVTPTTHSDTHKYETSSILACKHGSDGCFSTALGRRPTFSGTSILRIISFSKAVVYPWEFETCFDSQMLFLMPTHYRLGKRHWELGTSSVVVEHPPPYLNTLRNVKQLINDQRWKVECLEIFTTPSMPPQCTSPHSQFHDIQLGVSSTLNLLTNNRFCQLHKNSNDLKFGKLYFGCVCYQWTLSIGIGDMGGY